MYEHRNHKILSTLFFAHANLFSWNAKAVLQPLKHVPFRHFWILQAWGLQGSFFIHSYSHYFPFRKPTTQIVDLCHTWNMLYIRTAHQAICDPIHVLLSVFHAVYHRSYLCTGMDIQITYRKECTTSGYGRSASIPITVYTWQMRFFFSTCRLLS
jgi:hypothetical protein